MSREAFLGGIWTDVVSSNVAAARWDEEEGELQVRYKEGERWGYRVSRFMAAAFFDAASKGTWLWDNVRVRGKGGDGRHRVPARRLAA